MAKKCECGDDCKCKENEKKECTCGEECHCHDDKKKSNKKDELNKLKEENKELNDRVLRLSAEIQNIGKRHELEISNLMKYEGADLMRELNTDYLGTITVGTDGNWYSSNKNAKSNAKPTTPLFTSLLLNVRVEVTA